MSFVSKGEKSMHNMAKKGGSKGFVAKGQPKNKNVAPASKDQEKHPVSEDAMQGVGDASPVVASEFDPASGKRARSVADLRSAAKKLNERSMAGEASPTGSEGGQDGKHSSSKNASGFMKAGLSKMDKKSKKAPRSLASQEADPMVDPLDEDQDDNGQAEEGMTPQGKKRRSTGALRSIMKKMTEA